MNKPVYIAFFLLCSLLSQSANAQTNLVYNGDFELYDTCPTGASSPDNYQIEHCLGWKAPTYGTSDYYNSCASSSSLIGMPSNFAGYQIPHSGAGYCGFFGYLLGGAGCSYSGSYWYEYIQGQLTSPLVSGHQYEVSFYISLGNNSNTAVSGIGCYLSNTPITSCSTAPIAVQAQVRNPTGQFLTDTTTWIYLSSTFVAQGAEEYLTIGNFIDSTVMDTLRVVEDNFNFAVAYYIVDDVSVADLGIPDQPNVFTPDDDGINDAFVVYGLAVEESYSVLNRWGNIVFVGNKQSNWDGNDSSGTPCSEGVYFYITEKKRKTGFIQLLR